MIQSDIFDSADMDINKLSNSILNFIKKRLIEILGLIISTLGILLLLSLISYSPEDPNFIFPENYEIKNFLGFRGSFVSDLLFQSLGLITFLIPISSSTSLNPASTIVRSSLSILPPGKDI